MKATQHLTASDLMIGDWVKVTDDDTDEWFFGIVCGIDRYNVIVIQSGDSVGYPYAEECLEPIPLTPEILEKNGFTRDNRLYYRIQEKDGETTAGVYYWVDEKYVNIAGYEDDGVTISCPYVHILQHALKLCGISKEIVI